MRVNYRPRPSSGRWHWTGIKKWGPTWQDLGSPIYNHKCASATLFPNVCSKQTIDYPPALKKDRKKGRRRFFSLLTKYYLHTTLYVLRSLYTKYKVNWTFWACNLGVLLLLFSIHWFETSKFQKYLNKNSLKLGSQITEVRKIRKFNCQTKGNGCWK